mgnify:CR=1 FL=1
MDPKTCFLAEVKAQASVHHGDQKLRREALYVYNKCTDEQREWLSSTALTDGDRRKAGARQAGRKSDNKSSKVLEAHLGC